ncbi:MAG: hypothetical protein WDN46_23055 [Methylocella sp.]
MTRHSLAQQVEGLDLLALGQRDWLDRDTPAKKKLGEHFVQRKREQHEITLSTLRTLKAMAPYETELRAWLAAKIKEAKDVNDGRQPEARPESRVEASKSRAREGNASTRAG